MFGRSPKEPENQEPFNFPDVNLQSDRPGEIYQAQNDQDTVLQSEPEKTEIATNLEKISRVASPYFIVLIGLALYESNFILGMILIITGILSLLKVSTRDIANAVEWLKDTLGIGRD